MRSSALRARRVTDRPVGIRRHRAISKVDTRLAGRLSKAATRRADIRRMAGDIRSSPVTAVTRRRAAGAERSHARAQGVERGGARAAGGPAVGAVA